MKIFKPTDCNGHALVIVAIVLIVLLALVGLAIDGGRAYSVKARLNAALDAAGIAAARAIGNGENEAKDAATTFFNSNYHTGYMSSEPNFCPPDGDLTISADQNSGDIAITVWATAEMPNLFMKVIGHDTINVAATATVNRRAVDLAFVVDNTGSIGYSTGQIVKARSIDFVHAFHPNFDRLALVKYAYGAKVPVPIYTDSRGFPLSTVETEIGNFTFSGYTNCAEGFWQGKNQLEAVDSPSSIRVIVFFTDGAPNTISSYFNFSNNDPLRGSIKSGDGSSGDADGLWEHDDINDFISGYNYCRDSGCPDGYGWELADYLLGLPEFYNAHTNDINGSAAVYEEDPSDPDYHQFRVITGDAGGLFGDVIPGTRLVTQHNAGDSKYDLFDKVNNASRNLLEAMAKDAREQGIYVYTLGLGNLVEQPSGPNNEEGAVVLRRMANDIDADIRFADEPEGFYCHALTTNDLGPCYNRIIEEIIRLTI
jgi:Flp pilus assembly protein TadG